MAEVAEKTQDDKQRETDVSNLRFYADLFVERHWQTEVLHWSVFEHTLRAIADRIEREAEHG